MKQHIQIKNSYKIWNPATMKRIIKRASTKKYNHLIIEWWLHNVAYYLTKPFCNIDKFKKLNDRAKDVDLIVEIDNE